MSDKPKVDAAAKRTEGTSPTARHRPPTRTPSEAAISSGNKSIVKPSDSKSDLTIELSLNPPETPDQVAAVSQAQTPRGWVEGSQSTRTRTSEQAVKATLLTDAKTASAEQLKTEELRQRSVFVPSSKTVLSKLKTLNFGPFGFATIMLALFALVSFRALEKLDSIVNSIGQIAGQVRDSNTSSLMPTTPSEGSTTESATVQGRVMQPAAVVNASSASDSATPMVAKNQDLSQVIAAIEAIRKSLSTTEENVNKKLDAVNQLLTTTDEAAAEKVSRANSDFARLMNSRMDTQARCLNGIDDAINRIENRFKRDAAKEDVAVVLYHTSRLKIDFFTEALVNIFIKSDYSTIFQNYRVGLFRAANGKADTILIPWDRAKETPFTEAQLRFPAPDSSSSESTNLLKPNEVFDSKSNSSKRLIIVASILAKPPELTAPEWNGVECCVILVDDDRENIEVQNSRLNNWHNWTKFCQRMEPYGEAAIVSYDSKTQEKINEQRKAVLMFESKLMWYMRPRAIKQEKQE